MFGAWTNSASDMSSALGFSPLRDNGWILSWAINRTLDQPWLAPPSPLTLGIRETHSTHLYLVGHHFGETRELLVHWLFSSRRPRVCAIVE